MSRPSPAIRSCPRGGFGEAVLGDQLYDEAAHAWRHRRGSGRPVRERARRGRSASRRPGKGSSTHRRTGQNQQGKGRSAASASARPPPDDEVVAGAGVAARMRVSGGRRAVVGNVMRQERVPPEGRHPGKGVRWLLCRFRKRPRVEDSA